MDIFLGSNFAETIFTPAALNDDDLSFAKVKGQNNSL